MPLSFIEWVRALRHSSLLLAQAALWISVVLGGFLLPPPVGVTLAEHKIWLRLGQFIVGMLIGLTFLVAQAYQRRRDVVRWGVLAGAFLLCSVGSFFGYQHLVLEWTVPLRGERVLVGDLTPEAELYMKDHPGLPVGELYEKFAGKDDQIWTRPSRDRRRLRLAAVYVACAPLFTLSIISLLQAIYCVSPGVSSTGGSRTKKQKAIPPDLDRTPKAGLPSQPDSDRPLASIDTPSVIGAQRPREVAADSAAVTTPPRSVAPAPSPTVSGKPPIFLSYCRDDFAEASRLRGDLVAAGEQVWWDQEILPGQDWRYEIRQAMRQSCAVLLCLSARVMARQQSGVFPEASDAIQALREHPPGHIFLIPVRFSPCELPLIEIDATRTLDRLQAVDLFPEAQRDARLQQLLRAVRKSPRHPDARAANA